MKEIRAEQITQVIRDLCIEANCHLPKDVQNAITGCRACEPFPIAQSILGKIEENFTITARYPVTHGTTHLEVLVVD